VPLVVFAAGSLIIPFDALETAFEQAYPNIDVRAEYHGSIQVIRHTTELHDEIDVIATADAALIPMLMYAVNDPDTGQPYADWYVRFASNRLALAHTAQSQRAAEIELGRHPVRPQRAHGTVRPTF
jgi:molybdate/tungstate transport system substrate-binding protein